MGVETVATAALAGTSLYSAFNTPDSPTLQSYSAPANYFNYVYDDNGNLVEGASQVWDATKNAYIYKPAPMTDAEKADLKTRNELKSKYLGYLNQTPEDRLAAYETYKASYAQSLQKPVDESFKKTVATVRENMGARGMTGSRANVDTQSELTRQKLATDVDIAAKAEVAKEALAAQDKSEWLGTLGYLESAGSSKTAQQLAAAQAAGQQTSSANAANMARINATNAGLLSTYQNDLYKYQTQTSAVNNVLGGLAYLYGYNKGQQTPNVVSPNTGSNVIFGNSKGSGGWG
jgi:lipase chaperone LimK